MSYDGPLSGVSSSVINNAKLAQQAKYKEEQALFKEEPNNDYAGGVTGFHPNPPPTPYINLEALKVRDESDDLFRIYQLQRDYARLKIELSLAGYELALRGHPVEEIDPTEGARTL